MRKRRTYEEEAQRRRLAWKVFKWIRKNDPDLSVKINQDLYVVVKDILVNIIWIWMLMRKLCMRKPSQVWKC